MNPKYKIGDWVKTRQNKIRKILNITRCIERYTKKPYFVYNLHGDTFRYYEFGLTLLTDEDKLELL
jgi:hypothetical protein